MKELRFTANETILKAEETYTGIMRGSHNYLHLIFSFSPDWKDYRKVVSVKDVERNEYNSVLTANGVLLPKEVTGTSRIYVTVYGRKGEETVQTNTVVIEQL